MQPYHLKVFDPDQSDNSDVSTPRTVISPNKGRWIARQGHAKINTFNMEILCPVKVGSAKAPDAKPNFTPRPVLPRGLRIHLGFAKH